MLLAHHKLNQVCYICYMHPALGPWSRRLVRMQLSAAGDKRMPARIDMVAT